MQEQEKREQNNAEGQAAEDQQVEKSANKQNKSLLPHLQPPLKKSLKQKIKLIKQLNRVHLQFINTPNDNVLQTKLNNNIQNTQTQETQDNIKQIIISNKEKLQYQDDIFNKDHKKRIFQSIKMQNQEQQQISCLNLDSQQQNDQPKENVEYKTQHKINYRQDKIVQIKQSEEIQTFNRVYTEPNYNERITESNKLIGNICDNSFDRLNNQFQQQNQSNLINQGQQTKQIDNDQLEQNNCIESKDNINNFNLYQKISMNFNTMDKQQINPVKNQNQANQNNIIHSYQNSKDNPSTKYFKFELFEKEKPLVKNHEQDQDQKQQSNLNTMNPTFNGISNKKVSQTNNYIKQNTNNYKFQSVNNSMCQNNSSLSSNIYQFQTPNQKNKQNMSLDDNNNNLFLDFQNDAKLSNVKFMFKEISHNYIKQKLNENNLQNNSSFIKNQEKCKEFKTNKIQENNNDSSIQNISKSQQYLSSPLNGIQIYQNKKDNIQKTEDDSFFNDIISQKSEILNISNEQDKSSSNLNDDKNIEKSEETNLKKKNDSINLQQYVKLIRYRKIKCNQTLSPILNLKSQENMNESNKCITLPSYISNNGRKRVLSQQCSTEVNQSTLKIQNTQQDMKIEDINDKINLNDLNNFEYKKKCLTPQHIYSKTKQIEKNIKLNNTIGKNIQAIKEKTNFAQIDNLDHLSYISTENKRSNKFISEFKQSDIIQSKSPIQNRSNKLNEIGELKAITSINKSEGRDEQNKDIQLQHNEQHLKESEKQISIPEQAQNQFLKKQQEFLEMVDNLCINQSSTKEKTSSVRQKTQQNQDGNLQIKSKIDLNLVENTQIRPKTQQSNNKILNNRKNTSDSIRNTSNNIKQNQNYVKNNIKYIQNNIKNGLNNMKETQTNFLNIQNHLKNTSNNTRFQQNDKHQSDSKRQQKTLNSLKINSQFPSVSQSAKSKQEESFENRENQFLKFSERPKFKIRSFTLTSDASQDVQRIGNLSESMNTEKQICKKLELSDIKQKYTDTQRYGSKTPNIASKGVSLKTNEDFYTRFNRLKAQQNLEPKIQDIKLLIETSCRNQRRNSSSKSQQKKSKQVRFQEEDEFISSQNKLYTYAY